MVQLTNIRLQFAVIFVLRSCNIICPETSTTRLEGFREEDFGDQGYRCIKHNS